MKKINWKLRLKNKATLLTLATVLVTAVYGVLAALGITPGVAQEQVMNLVVSLVAVLAALGIVVDPTTAGIADSDRAMGYSEPREDGE